MFRDDYSLSFLNIIYLNFALSRIAFNLARVHRCFAFNLQLNCKESNLDWSKAYGFNRFDLLGEIINLKLHICIWYTDLASFLSLQFDIRCFLFFQLRGLFSMAEVVFETLLKLKSEKGTLRERILLILQVIITFNRWSVNMWQQILLLWLLLVCQSIICNRSKLYRI